MTGALHLFQAYGIELEYMIVDRDTLKVKPICDKVIERVAGTVQNEVSLGTINISNELVLHVIEFKCNGPQKDLAAIRDAFQEQIRAINNILKLSNAQLLPTAMHPFMDPNQETVLWPHGQNEIYEIYNKIFDCRGHGWANLQSIHINLPFADDEEFARLHAAIRIVLPLLPGIAASSPLVEGKFTGKLDSRLNFYTQNQAKIPSIIGQIIPERVFSKAEYEAKIFQMIENDLVPYNPGGVLEPEWVNSRGAIARFDRQAIEIRVLDVQESVSADFAIIALVVSLVKSLVDELWIPLNRQKSADEKSLKEVFLAAIEDGGATFVADSFLMACFQSKEPMFLQSLWLKILDTLVEKSYPVKDFADDARKIIERGTLARKLESVLGENPEQSAIEAEYRRLANCLQTGEIYV